MESFWNRRLVLRELGATEWDCISNYSICLKRPVRPVENSPCRLSVIFDFSSRLVHFGDLEISLCLENATIAGREADYDGQKSYLGREMTEVRNICKPRDSTSIDLLSIRLTELPHSSNYASADYSLQKFIRGLHPPHLGQSGTNKWSWVSSTVKDRRSIWVNFEHVRRRSARLSKSPEYLSPGGRKTGGTELQGIYAFFSLTLRSSILESPAERNLVHAGGKGVFRWNPYFALLLYYIFFVYDTKIIGMASKTTLLV